MVRDDLIWWGIEGWSWFGALLLQQHIITKLDIVVSDVGFVVSVLWLLLLPLNVRLPCLFNILSFGLWSFRFVCGRQEWNVRPNRSSAGVVGWGVARYIWSVLLSSARESFLSTMAVCQTFLQIFIKLQWVHLLPGLPRWMLAHAGCLPIWSTLGVYGIPYHWKAGH